MKSNTIAKTLRERLEKIHERIIWLENRTSISPASQLIELRIECQEKMKSFPSNLDALKDKGFSKFLSSAAIKEKELLKMMKEDESKYWDELGELRVEEYNLKNRIFIEERNS